MAIGDGKRGGRGVMSWVKPDVAEHTLTSALAIVAMGVGWKVLNPVSYTHLDVYKRQVQR